MADVAFFTFLLTVSSRGKARAAGKVSADAFAGPDGYDFSGCELNCRRGTMNWVGNSLEGYYTSVRRAILISLVFRTIVMGLVVRWISQTLIGKIRGRWRLN